MERHETLVLADQFVKSLSDYPQVKELSERGKHFVLCSECLKKMINSDIEVHMLKFQQANKWWMTNNVLYFAHRDLTEQVYKQLEAIVLKRETNKMVLVPLMSFKPFTKFDVRQFLKLLTMPR